MSGRVPLRRTTGHTRRGRDIRRASAGLSPLRAGAILAMLLSAGAIYGIAASSAFGFAQVTLDGAHLTTQDAVTSALGLTDGTNLITLRTDGLAAALRRLPTVRDATIAVDLPDTVRVHIDEREPIILWVTSTGRYLVDSDGLLFAGADASPPGALTGLKVIADKRASSAGLLIGASLDPVDLDAATRLGSLSPADVGSTAASLSLSIDDDHGFVMTSGPGGWTATFGFYTPSLLPPDRIPEQVRTLSSVFAGFGEGTIATVILAGDQSGTFTRRDGK
jgi:POTRA domain, FtsQ-type